MNVFLAALNSLVPHYRVHKHRLLLAQGHPFRRVEIDLRQVAAHKFPELATLRLRLLRGRWMSFSTEGFRPAEIRELSRLLTRWEKRNHAPDHT